MADEAICTGRITINENNVTTSVDYHLPEKHRIAVSSWSNANSDILGDLVKIQNASKNKIVRALTSNKVMGYILNNSKMASIASERGEFLTADFATSYIKSRLGIEFIVCDGTYKKSAKDTTEYNFFKDDVIAFLTTDGTLGNTFVTSAPEEDYGIAQRTQGLVAVTQWTTNDPAGVWSKASAIGFPAFRNIKQLYICTVGA